MIKDFEYLKPESLEEACSLLSNFGEEAKIIAGGQSLLVFMKQWLLRPSYLIDIKGLADGGLSYITSDKEGLKIGAVTTHREIEKSPIIQREMRVIAEMEQEVADIQIRNWGTIGGNLCHADPEGDPAPLLIALKAVLKVVSTKGERLIQVEDFFKDYFETTLQADEILSEIQIPRPSSHTGVAYLRLPFMRGERPMVSTAVSIALEDDRCTDIIIGLGGVSSTPLRAKKAEEILKGKSIEESLVEEAARVASEGCRPASDVHGSEEYKRKMVGVLFKRTAKEALRRAKEA